MKVIIYIILFVTISCQYLQDKEEKLDISEYSGWWIYGEEQHLFKDESTLEEWELKFLNENLEELESLYLEITEMEYFPMECIMQGYLGSDTLYIIDFEITYVQGCGEE